VQRDELLRKHLARLGVTRVVKLQSLARHGVSVGRPCAQKPVDFRATGATGRRFVLAPDKAVTPDIDGRLPGRGAWVTATAENLGLALKRGAFARAFKSPARAEPALPAQVEALLAKRVLDLLGLARGAGQVIAGYEQVRDALKSEEVACLIEASDGSSDGRRKLASLSFAVSRGHAGAAGQEMLLIGCFTADELGMALGRARVIHACLTQGPFARKWIGEVSRLAGFRPIRPAVWTTGPLGGREQAGGESQGAD
jgi:predicted RNA-binding protein YlxR (DUF448 family)